MKRSRIKHLDSISLPAKIKKYEKYSLVARKIDDLLQITVYCGKDKNASYNIFIDKNNEDWINRVNYLSQKPTFSDTMIDNLCRDAWYYGYKCYGEETIEEYFHDDIGKKNYISIIGNWQLKIKHKRNDIRLEKLFKKWDDELSVFPNKLLPSFEKFMKKKASGEYFMFYKNKDSKIGYCSHCGKEVPLMKKPKQNEAYRCPSCRAKALFKQQDKIQTLETNYYQGAYAQKIDDKIIIRKFCGRQYYRGRDYKNPSVYLSETVRYILYKDGTTSRYWHGMYNPRICRWNKNTRDEGWARIFHYSHDSIRNVYIKNLSTILGNSAWKCWKKKPTDLMRYLVIENQTCGVIEKLSKVGLFSIAKELMYNDFSYFSSFTNKNGKDLGQIIKLDNARLKRLCKFDNVNYYNWLKKEKEQNTLYDDEMLKNFVNMDLSTYSFKSLPVQMNYTQINNYIVKQSALSSEDYKQVVNTWRDYLSIAKKNGWDVDNSIIYRPKDLKEKHTEALLFRDGSSMEEETKEIEEKWPDVNKNLAVMKPFEYENEEYCIVVPNNVADIVREGHSLQHCIHEVPFYFDRIEKRESYIFFLRRKLKPELSWYTLEVEQSGNILQKRTTGDNQNKDLEVAIPFLKEFQKHFISTMSDEDKVLGIKAEENRKKRYKELRDKKSKIWKGKLAGKLLADVLENDLMIA